MKRRTFVIRTSAVALGMTFYGSSSATHLVPTHATTTLNTSQGLIRHGLLHQSSNILSFSHLPWITEAKTWTIFKNGFGPSATGSDIEMIALSVINEEEPIYIWIEDNKVQLVFKDKNRDASVATLGDQTSYAELALLAKTMI